MSAAHAKIFLATRYEIENQSEAMMSTDTFSEIYASPAAKLRLDKSEGETVQDAMDRHFFIQSLRSFIKEKCSRLASLREMYGLLPCREEPDARPSRSGSKRHQALHSQESSADEIAVGKLFRVTEKQLHTFMENCAFKYSRASIEPGAAVGAVGAQSIGEPGTQMTLKTFHFAGIAAMNITQGVPRIKEIINASKNVSTPVITAPIDCEEGAEQVALVSRIEKARVDRCLLGDIAKKYVEVYGPDEVHMVVHLDLAHIASLSLRVDVHAVANAILASPLKIKAGMLTIASPSRIKVRPPPSTKSTTFFSLQALREGLPKVMVRGDKNIRRVIIQASDDKLSAKLLVEGTDMRTVMASRGVRGTEVTSNHIIDVERCLGIEAARNSIIHEIQSTMAAHGMTIDSRHVMLLADLMTFKGEILGITRFGIAKMKSSTFMLASFEKTTDHLFDAALHGNSDPIDGVSECIILGKPMKIGTGLFDLVQEHSDKCIPKQRNLLFETHAG